VLLYAGHDGEMIFGDLWERREGDWVLLDSIPAARRVLNGH
jgi:hypothetical protein